METSINERVNSQLYSDVISSYVDINSITAQRNIVPGSFKETMDQCMDQTLATLNSAGGQTLFTRLRISPTSRNATLAQLAKIYFQYQIPENSLGLLMGQMSGSANENEPSAITQNGNAVVNIHDHLRFKLFYNNGFSIASMVELCLGADAKISTGNFNYQQSMLTLNSLPDFITDHSTSETTLKALVEDTNYAGVGSGLIDIDLDQIDANKYYAWPINKVINIEGLCDLDRGNPLFHNFPIITRNMGELYIRLYMENFLRELKIVYLNKHDHNTAGNTQTWYLPYQALPVDKPDIIMLDNVFYKVQLVNIQGQTFNNTTSYSFGQFPLIRELTNIHWSRFEVRRYEFDIQDYEDIKASQARAGVFKFPVHAWRSKNFDQTNQASNSSNALQTTLNCPNIDRMFITMPLLPDYYTFCPTIASTDINPQIDNSPVLPRTEDNLNIRTVERIGSVFVDTDKYSMPNDLYNSLSVPTLNKHLWEKSTSTYGGAGAFCNIQRGYTISAGKDDPIVYDNKIYIPNKFAYALELNEGGCFRRGYNSVLEGRYKSNLPVNLQQSTTTSYNIYWEAHSGTTEGNMLKSNKEWIKYVQYDDYRNSGAVSSIHCLCDYIFKVSFDQYGMMTDFSISEYDDR